MNMFYNPEGIGDTLLVSLKEISKEKRDVEQKGDVARLFNINSGETVGWHVFNVSTFGSIHEKGMLPVKDEYVSILNEALKESGWEAVYSRPEVSSFVVGYVEEKKKHPDADKLSVCQVDIGETAYQIVCGAPNVKAGQKVVVALPGAFMPTGMKIKAAKLRGVDSTGMICSAKELALPEHEEGKGILVLDENYDTGQDFLTQYHSSKA
ncbi:YtpR family tRNA-binding protein [Salsuginibacillus kocurii]|uniref:YtpR family tRNA-binding protein n=1 Tax=Salsuginibacillus kocurii TaxID=427078 RepID=UPI00037D3BC2|nr:DUF4479 family protein [Salsuginibacillus kocurii]